MSMESAKAFIERMKADEAFNNRVSVAKDQEARFDIVKGEGYDFSADEIRTAGSELTDAEMSEIAGGAGEGEQVLDCQMKNHLWLNDHGEPCPFPLL